MGTLGYWFWDFWQELFDQEEPEEVTGPVKYIHQYVDMPNEKATITLANGTEQEVSKSV
jgi:neutral ceramidase